jgi:hypothetical protein
MFKKFISQHLVLTCILIAIILFGFVLLVSTVKTNKQPPEKSDQVLPPKKVSITHAPKTSVKPLVAYNEHGVALRVDKIKNPQPLTQSDYAARKRLVDTLGGKSGILQKTATYRVEYFKSPDEFMVAIRDINIGNAKKDAIAWFTAQGISANGLCNLPVTFYLEPKVARQIQSLRMTFNLMPDYCY